MTQFIQQLEHPSNLAQQQNQIYEKSLSIMSNFHQNRKRNNVIVNRCSHKLKQKIKIANQLFGLNSETKMSFSYRNLIKQLISLINKYKGAKGLYTNQLIIFDIGVLLQILNQEQFLIFKLQIISICRYFDITISILNLRTFAWILNQVQFNLISKIFSLKQTLTPLCKIKILMNQLYLITFMFNKYKKQHNRILVIYSTRIKIHQNQLLENESRYLYQYNQKWIEQFDRVFIGDLRENLKIFREKQILDRIKDTSCVNIVKRYYTQQSNQKQSLFMDFYSYKSFDCQLRYHHDSPMLGQNLRSYIQNHKYYNNYNYSDKLDPNNIITYQQSSKSHLHNLLKEKDKQIQRIAKQNQDLRKKLMAQKAEFEAYRKKKQKSSNQTIIRLEEEKRLLRQKIQELKEEYKSLDRKLQAILKMIAQNHFINQQISDLNI